MRGSRGKRNDKRGREEGAKRGYDRTTIADMKREKKREREWFTGSTEQEHSQAKSKPPLCLRCQWRPGSIKEPTLAVVNYKGKPHKHTALSSCKSKVNTTTWQRKWVVLSTESLPIFPATFTFSSTPPFSLFKLTLFLFASSFELTPMNSLRSATVSKAKFSYVNA